MAGASGRHSPDQSMVHLCRGVDRDLLLKDDVQQGAEPVAAAPEPRRAGGSQYRGEDWFRCEGRNALGETMRRVTRMRLAFVPRRTHSAPG